VSPKIRFDLYLVRDTYSREMGTFGTLSVFRKDPDDIEARKMFECETVEKPWAGNLPYISCIPEGLYPVSRRMFYRKNYMAYEIEDVPSRTVILLHIANRARDVMGCVGVGAERGYIKGEWAVSHSGDTFHALDALLGQVPEPETEMWITISSVFKEISEWGTRAV
jgi:hypothetical protein